MKTPTFLIVIILLIGIKINAQELTCEDFKIGEFYIPEIPGMEKYTIVSNDSIWEYSPELDQTIKKHIVIREKDTQIEWINGIGNGSPSYEIIEWIDDCTYRLTYDSSKTELDEYQQWINDNDGIVVSKIKIENKCLYYTATMNANDGRKISQDGIICKD